MKTLDELIPDEGILFFHKTPAYIFPDQITGKDLKAAINQRIEEVVDARIRDLVNCGAIKP